MGLVEVLLRPGREGADGDGGGVRDHDVGRAELGLHLREELLDLRADGEIAALGDHGDPLQHQIRGEALEVLLVTGADRDLRRPLPRQLERDRATETSRRAAHDGGRPADLRPAA